MKHCSSEHCSLVSCHDTKLATARGANYMSRHDAYYGRYCAVTCKLQPNHDVGLKGRDKGTRSRAVDCRVVCSIERARWGSTYGVVRLNERIVDSNNLDVGVLDGVAEDDTADTTETVDADLDGSHFDYCRRNGSFC